jgi:hypothetical protein
VFSLAPFFAPIFSYYSRFCNICGDLWVNHPLEIKWVCTLRFWPFLDNVKFHESQFVQLADSWETSFCAHSLLKQQLHSRQLLGTNLFMFDFANSGLCYLWSKILTFEERVLREGPCVGSKSPGRIVLKDALCMRVAGICWKSAIQPSIVYANQPSQQCKSFGTVKGKSSESERNSRAWLKPI